MSHLNADWGAVATVAGALAAVLGALSAVAASYWQLRQSLGARALEENIARSISDTDEKIRDASPQADLSESSILHFEQNEGLLRQYHAQGLRQSNTSFWFSIYSPVSDLR